MDPANISVTGRVGRDPEVMYATTGTAMCKFSLAVNGMKNKQTDETPTSWWDCICWGQKAEAAGQYLKKGSKVTIEGRPELREWVSQDGSKRKNGEIHVTNFYNQSPRDENGHSNGHAPLEELAPVAVGAVVGVTEDDDKDPFADE